MFVKQINVTFTDGEHSALTDVKGDRSWHDAIIEEFGVSDT